MNFLKSLDVRVCITRSPIVMVILFQSVAPCFTNVIWLRNDFFTSSFFVSYILSFGLVRLWTIRLSARAGAHIGYSCSRSCAEDVTITNVIIKHPDRKFDWGVNDVMPGSDGLRILVIYEKNSELRSDAGWGELIFEPGRSQSSCGLRDAPRVVGSDGTVSIVKIVSLSLLVSKT